MKTALIGKFSSRLILRNLQAFQTYLTWDVWLFISTHNMILGKDLINSKSRKVTHTFYTRYSIIAKWHGLTGLKGFAWRWSGFEIFFRDRIFAYAKLSIHIFLIFLHSLKVSQIRPKNRLNACKMFQNC